MEPGDIDKGVGTEAQRELYHVKLRVPLVNYFEISLSRIYNTELQEVQKDGAYHKVLEFKNSPFSRLMGKLAPPQEDQKDPASHRTIELTKEDIALMTSKIQSPAPTDYAGSVAHRELVDELKDNFQTVKTTTMLKRRGAKVKAFLTKK